METIPSGLTWEQVIAKIAEAGEFTLTLTQRPRRTNKRLRAIGETDERKVWRLNLQKDHKNFQRTIFSKNVRVDSDALLSETACDKLVAKINNALEPNA